MKGDKFMSIFVQVSSTPESMYDEAMYILPRASSTPESVYKEINQETYTDDYYLSMFLERLAGIVESYRSPNKNKRMTVDTLVRVLIRGLIYKESTKRITNAENVPYTTVRQQIDLCKASAIRFRGWGKGITFKYPPTPVFRYAASENEIIRAFKNKFGEVFDYERFYKNQRVQETLKLKLCV